MTLSYRKTLNKAFDAFRDWCYLHGHKHPDDYGRNPELMNEALVEHVQFLFDEGKGVSAGRHAVLAIHHRFPLLRPFMRQSWDSVKSWEQLAPVNLRTPIPPLVFSCMFIYALLMGFQCTGPTARDWITFAVGLRCCFEGLLRPGEFCALTSWCVAVPAGRLHGLVRNGMMTVVNGKNRRIFGRIQIALLDEGIGLRWLTWLTRGMNPGTRLFHGGTAKFRRLFAVATRALGVESLKLNPASLRAGGATHLFVSGAYDIGRIQYRGRWGSLSTLQHYLQEASASLVLLRLSDSVVEQLLALQENGSVFEQPPHSPWNSFFDRPRPQWTPKRSSRRSALRRL